MQRNPYPMFISTVLVFFLSSAALADRLNGTIATLEQKKPVFGLFTADFSQQNARALAASDLDYIFIDMEHTPMDGETLRSFLLGMINPQQIAESGSTRMRVTPIVRIPQYGSENLQFLVKQVLDLGAYGVLFPFIGNKAEAENAVKSMRYPAKRGAPYQNPRGTRGASPGNARWFWGTGDYMAKADTWPLNPQGELLAVLQIESEEGAENIDEILSVGGIGAIFIGPSDLAMSLGVSGDHPDLETAIQKVLKSCLAHGVPCGLTTSGSNVQKRLDEGFNFVTIGYWSDAGISTSPGDALRLARKHSGRD